MAVETIADVLHQLDNIIDRARDQASRLGYFAALYRRVTERVSDGVTQGQFQNGPLLARLDVVFASRYLNALQESQNGGTPSRSWALAFNALGIPRH